MERVAIIGERFNYHKDWRPCRPESELNLSFLIRLGCMRRGAARQRLLDLGFEWDCGLNLLMPSKTSGKWDARRAREVATAITEGLLLRFQHVILLGQNVATAFGIQRWEPFMWCELSPSREWWRYEDVRQFLTLPHPSGRCRTWNDPEAIDRAKGLADELRMYAMP